MNLSPIKCCLRCKTGKPKEDFEMLDNGYPDVLCKPCRKEKDAEQSLTGFSKRVQYLAYRHKVSVQFIVDLFIASEGKCQICGFPFEKLMEKQIHVDHDHFTGKVRGILCVGCNSGLGAFHDSATKVEKAREYLLLHNAYDKYSVDNNNSNP